ncbi:MAG: hypothetical protein M3040_05400 [Bacteroidota bacterium]|nr:hypothetical protein [Bacteroidota bacterium]
MHVLPLIQHLENKEIDKALWDDCITRSNTGLIYAKTFYLDNMAKGWSALVGDNYGWVFPVTARKKYGVSYLCQPAFTQQLGTFSKPGVTVPYTQVIAYLQGKYRLCEINWNFGLQQGLEGLSVSVEKATNFVLDLSQPSTIITENYHRDLAKNLKKNKRFNHRYVATNDFKKCIEVYRHQYGKRMPHVSEYDYKNFDKICLDIYKQGKVICREVVNEKQVLMATALLLFDGKRLYNLMNSTTDLGRKTGANHFLLNALIEEFSGKEITLDFEGSDLPGVRSFYENFGGVNQSYFKIKYNHLSWPFRLFKK